MEKDEEKISQIISRERKTDTFDYKKIYSIYNTCCIKTIIELKKKLDNNYNYIEMGISILYYIFFLILRYTRNLKLCLKLSERAILLYTEFIIQSKEKRASGDLIFSPSIGDAVAFSYRKTIGNLNIKKIKKETLQSDDTLEFKWIMEACEFMNRVYIIFSNNEKADLEVLQKIKLHIYTELYYLFQQENKQKNIQLNQLNLLLQKGCSDCSKWISLKIFLELYKSKCYIPIHEYILLFQTKNIACMDFSEAVNLNKTFYKNIIKKWLNESSFAKYKKTY